MRRFTVRYKKIGGILVILLILLISVTSFLLEDPVDVQESTGAQFSGEVSRIDQIDQEDMPGHYIFFTVARPVDSGVELATLLRRTDGTPFRAVIPAGCDAAKIRRGDSIRLIAIHFRSSFIDRVTLLVVKCPHGAGGG